MFITILKHVLIVVEVICCALLIGVILLQRSKGQGMGGMAFGGGMGETLFGSQVGNVLTRITVILAIVFLTTTTLLVVIGARGRVSSLADRIPVEQAPVTPIPAPVGPIDAGN